MSAVEDATLPETMSGHWDTPDGRSMAIEYAGKRRDELMKGELSDLSLANAVFLASRDDLDLIHYQQAAKERIRWLSAQLAIAIEGLNERARLIVELLAMPKTNVGFAGDIHIRRARRIIDGDNDSKARGEANYRAYCAASPDHESEGTIEGLQLVATMIDEYSADSLPANEHGQIHFARAMLESASSEIKAYLASLRDLGAPNV